jgi:hypothetical protein
MLYPLSYERWEVKILPVPANAPRGCKNPVHGGIRSKPELYGM